jgi:hypothetical protein
MAGLAGVAVGNPHLGRGVAEEIAHHPGGAAVGDDVVDRGGAEQYPLPPGFPIDPGRGLVGGHHLGLAHLRGDRRSGGREFGLGAGEQIGDGALADDEAEHLGHQPRQPLEADRLGHVQVQDQGRDTRVEGRTRRHALRRRRG